MKANTPIETELMKNLKRKRENEILSNVFFKFFGAWFKLILLILLKKMTDLYFVYKNVSLFKKLYNYIIDLKKEQKLS
jgi:hypothetical protein